MLAMKKDQAEQEAVEYPQLLWRCTCLSCSFEVAHNHFQKYTCYSIIHAGLRRLWIMVNLSVCILPYVHVSRVLSIGGGRGEAFTPNSPASNPQKCACKLL